MSTRLGDLLVQHQRDLEAWVRAHAGRRILRYESCSDVVQAIICAALEQEHNFEYQGERPFLAWMYRVARHALLDRARYWSATRRDSTKVIRLLEAESRELDPPASITSPSSRAARREQILLVTKALSGLPERDRELVGMAARGMTMGEIARALELSPNTAKQARRRALERLVRLCRLHSQWLLPPGL